MSTWEERMAELHRKEPEPYRPPEPTEVDEQTIFMIQQRMTPKEAYDRLHPTGEIHMACACTGGPPGATMCNCHLVTEAAARICGEPCPWRHHHDA